MKRLALFFARLHRTWRYFRVCHYTWRLSWIKAGHAVGAFEDEHRNVALCGAHTDIH